MTSIKRQVISGINWTVANKIFVVSFGLIKIAILTRFLDKTDFGIMALVMSVVRFVSMFMDIGLTTAILHFRDITKKQYSSIYWVNIGISLILYLILWGISPLVSNVYDVSALSGLISIVGLIIIIKAIGAQFRTVERKSLKFKFISTIDIISALISLIIAIILALLDYGVYALVYSVVAQSAFTNLIFLYYIIKEKRVYLYLNIPEIKSFLRIGIFNLGGQIVNYFNRELDVILIGKIFGIEILGGYSLAKQLVIRPYSIINPIVTTVASPALAKFQNNIEELKNKYLYLVNVISSINIPVYLILIVFASPIVKILYGIEYEGIVGLVRILSVFMLARSIQNPMGSLVTATGRTELEFYLHLLLFPCMCLAIYFGSRISIEWVAVFIAIVGLLFALPGIWLILIRRMTKASFKEYLVACYPRTRKNLIKLIDHYRMERKIST